MGGADKPGRNWWAIGAFIVAVSVAAGNALSSYGRDQVDAQVRDAKAASASELVDMRQQDSVMSSDIAVLKAQRVEDSERLKRIEQMVLEMRGMLNNGRR